MACRKTPVRDADPIRPAQGRPIRQVQGRRGREEVGSGWSGWDARGGLGAREGVGARKRPV